MEYLSHTCIHTYIHTHTQNTHSLDATVETMEWDEIEKPWQLKHVLSDSVSVCVSLSLPLSHTHKYTPMQDSTIKTIEWNGIKELLEQKNTFSLSVPVSLSQTHIHTHTHTHAPHAPHTHPCRIQLSKRWSGMR